MPTEEEPAIAILAALLEQFPVIATYDDEGDCYALSELARPSASTVQPINLATWTIETAEPHQSNDDEQRIAMSEGESELTCDESEPTCAHTSPSVSLPITRQASAAAMLHTLPADFRTPTIQIGFNFAESESV